MTTPGERRGETSQCIGPATTPGERRGEKSQCIGPARDAVTVPRRPKDDGCFGGPENSKGSIEVPRMIGAVDMIENKEEWMKTADEIRRNCYDDIGMSRPTTRLHGERPVKQLAQASTIDQGWQVLSIAVDSGAAETVVPYKLIRNHPIHETEASRSGLNYASAIGDPIPNLGEQSVPMCTREGTLRSMTFQAAPVTRPLGSVKRICQTGHRVVFDDSGSFIENKSTGEINMLREEDGNYVLDVWVLPNKSGFGGLS